MEQENNKEAETPVKTLPESNMNKQEENKEAVEAPEETSSKPDSNKNEAGTSRNRTPRSLKANQLGSSQMHTLSTLHKLLEFMIKLRKFMKEEEKYGPILTTKHSLGILIPMVILLVIPCCLMKGISVLHTEM